MSSNQGDGHHGSKNEDAEADETVRTAEARLLEGGNDTEILHHHHFVEMEDEAGEQSDVDGLIEQEEIATQDIMPVDGELSEQDFAQLRRGDQSHFEDTGVDAGLVPPIPDSPLTSIADSSSGSIPDDTPSLQGSLASTPIRDASPASRKPISRSSSGALQPFERRFESRVSSPSPGSPRAASPAFLSPRSRQISLSSQISQISSQDDDAASETPSAPWEVIRWTKLRKIAGQAFSEAGKRNFGRPTCMAVSALIAIGTSKGLILGFDYHQTLKIIIGQGTKATECGSVTALAIAADYSTVASGHANGHIFTWEINKPARPFLQIPSLDPRSLRNPQHSDGHVTGCAILHIGFLGTRHTALVSADAGGMAFSHVATRGLGPVTRTVKATRLLGRYPSANPQAQRNQKPSSVLAFSPLPLGNVEQATDNMGLTALLTPYLLVIVSTTPIAQTQHKSPRPKEISTHGTLSGCLAWFPAVKLKTPGPDAQRTNSDTKLVYCWSNVLTILDVKVLDAHVADTQKPPELDFQPRNRWRAEEAIVAVQWVGRSVLAILTVSQRLLIVEDGSLQVTDSIDLLHRHIYHQDLFSRQLHAVVEQLNSAEPSLHGVVADAFYMSFKTHKGRAFLLGFNDLTVGTLSNWADRLIALMEAGDHIAAIRLATDYYGGSASNVTIGLPDNETTRHEMVKERLVAMISASLTYTFSQHGEGRETRLQELIEVCFNACVAMDETVFLFSDVFEQFQETDEISIFITTLEPYVLEGDISVLPPEVVQSLVSHFISENEAARLEEMLFRLDPTSFDLDQITMLCRQHSLYDALIYIWTQGMGDYVTPLIDLLTLVKLQQAGDDEGDLALNPYFEPAMKVFPYLAYSLTGRRYPKGEIMGSPEATKAKADLYGYIFSGTTAPWPRGSNKVFRTTDRDINEPAFPYLHLLLQFDTSSFMSMLNEAFEDPFLNQHDDDDHPVNGALSTVSNDGRASIHKSRQQIIEMLDVMRQGDFSPEQIIYLDMFIARSVPKYPGQLILSGNLLSNVLQRLCDPPSHELRDDCQLSIEYLLSAYRPSDITALISSLKEASYYRVLKSVYRTERMLTQLLETFFEDPNEKESVFDAIAFCLRGNTGATPKQLRAVETILEDHVQDLADIDVVLTARALATYAPDLLQPGLHAVSDSHQQFIYLRTLLEPMLLGDDRFASSPLSKEKRFSLTEQYVQLMCRHDPAHVAVFVESLPSGDLHLEGVLPAMEECGVVDAAVVLLVREGLARDAMDRLVAHVKNLYIALTGLVEAAKLNQNIGTSQDSSEDLIEQVEKYTKIGISLCQGQRSSNRHVRHRTNPAWEIKEDDLDLDEYLWLNLVDVVVQASQAVNSALTNIKLDSSSVEDTITDTTKTSSALRSNVQQTFTALLASTTSPNEASKPRDNSRSYPTPDHLSFLRVLRAFLSRAAQTAPSLADLRAVLSDIFSAYTFEQGVLTLANELLGSDVFTDIYAAHQLRQRGWRPRTQACEHCKRRAWGTGVGELVWDEWVARERGREFERERKGLERGGGEIARRMERGKGKASATGSRVAEEGEAGEAARKLTLVAFACRHVFHRVCIDEDYKDGKSSASTVYTCPICPA